jgi:hypothetical protein
MQIKALLNSPMGKVFISILLGLGLATMFRTVCEEKNCIRFAGPVISDVDETKRVLDIKVKPKEGDFGLGFGEF